MVIQSTVAFFLFSSKLSKHQEIKLLSLHHNLDIMNRLIHPKKNLTREKSSRLS